MKDKDWLNEMIGAAVEDDPETYSKPDYAAVRLGSKTEKRGHFGRTASNRIVLAAAALILALPAGILLGRKADTMQMMRDESDLFVRELLGVSIFEEVSEPMEAWTPGEFLGGGLFDSADET